MLDEVSPLRGDEDDLHDAVNEVSFLLAAFARRLPRLV
jgi:hypothetical protein